MPGEQTQHRHAPGGSVSLPPGEHAEVMIPGGDDPANPGDQEEKTGKGIPDLGSFAAEATPIRSAVERVGRKGEEDDADADADGGMNHSGHIRAPRLCG
jgi:hypothetical protein